MSDAPHFMLVGSAPYLNRGCEAIVRGTMTILRRSFGDNIRVTLASFGPPDVISQQASQENDPSIQHVRLPYRTYPRLVPGSPRWFVSLFPRVSERLLRMVGKRYLLYVRTDVQMELSVLDDPSQSASLALEVGGDNYSLDYGPPTSFFRMDEYLWEKHVPVVLWGASVGPFGKAPFFAPRAFRHLRRMALIMPREDVSCEYLRTHNVADNVVRMCDPAFVMEAVRPEKEKMAVDIPKEAIGLNFSPLMARYVTEGNQQLWEILCEEMVERVARDIDRPILLIPHVTVPRNNDHLLLQTVMSRMSPKYRSRIICLGDNLSAAETKWVIAQCSVFAGARTHATIAAMSSCIPTMSLAYSIKARGLNQDVFGTQDYCMNPKQLSPEAFSECLRMIIDREESIRQHLQQRMPSICEMAFKAGERLVALLNDRKSHNMGNAKHTK